MTPIRSSPTVLTASATSSSVTRKVSAVSLQWSNFSAYSKMASSPRFLTSSMMAATCFSCSGKLSGLRFNSFPKRSAFVSLFKSTIFMILPLIFYSSILLLRGGRLLSPLFFPLPSSWKPGSPPFWLKGGIPPLRPRGRFPLRWILSPLYHR